MNRNAGVGLLLLIGFALPPAGQSDPLSLTVSPGVQIPLGPSTEDGTPYYSVGGGAALTAERALPAAPRLSARGLLAYTVHPTAAQNSLSLISLGGGMGFSLEPLPKMVVSPGAVAGYSFGLYRQTSGETAAGQGPFVLPDVRVSYQFSRLFQLGFELSYRLQFAAPASGISVLYHGLGASIGARIGLGGGARKSKIEIFDVRIEPVFPILYQRYDSSPIGTVTLRNRENGPVRDVRVSFFVGEYMDRPKLCAEIPQMAKNEERQVPLFGLFRENILGVTEGKLVTGEIHVEYTFLDESISGDRTESLLLNHRNAMTWDDDRKAASFVTARDPEVLRFSKSVAGEVRKHAVQAFSEPFRVALGVFEALKLYGVSYVVDPTTPYAEYSKNEFALDFLQFPVQTLTYRGGDCDDLSILYAALLESVGIETAFITVPAHIYVAFSLGMDADEANHVFRSSSDLILRDGRVWVPVEITMMDDGFLKAWQAGARQWRDNDAAGTAELFPMHVSWKRYPPVALPDTPARPESVAADALVRSYAAALDGIVRREIHDRVADLEERIRRSNGDPVLVNRLGILYARFGQYEESRVQFERAAAQGHTPALVNLGNLWFLQGEHRKALEQLESADRKGSENASVLVGLVKVHHELENYGAMRESYRRLEALSPRTAERFAYLVSRDGEQTRASAALRRHEVLWDVE